MAGKPNKEAQNAAGKPDENKNPSGLGDVTSNNQKIGAEPGNPAHVEGLDQRDDHTAPLSGQVGGNADGASIADQGSKAPQTAPGNDTEASAHGEGLAGGTVVEDKAPDPAEGLEMLPGETGAEFDRRKARARQEAIRKPVQRMRGVVPLG